MTILITDSNYKHTLGIIRALGAQKVYPYVLSDKKNSLASYSKYCKKEIVIHSDLGNEDDLMNQLKQNQINHIIPVGVNSFKKMFALKQKLDLNHIQCILPSQNSFNVCISKYQTYTLAKQLCIPVPETYILNTKQQDNLKQKLNYPCVLKAEQEFGGSIVKYINTPAEFNKTIESTFAQYSTMKDSDFILQDYIEGQGYGFFAVYNNGHCGATFQHRRLREFPPSGGYSVAAESVKENQLEEYGKKILDYLQWHGVAMVEFKKKKNGEFILMEINPKFWGSLDLALEAGVNFPYELIKIANNEAISFSKSYRYPFRYHWPLHGDIHHVLLKPSTMLSYIKDSISPKCKSNLWILKDIKPTLYMGLYIIFSVIKYAVKKLYSWVR